MVKLSTNISIIGFLILLCITDVSQAEYGDMDPGSCAPSGLVNKTKSAMDPKGFWVNMYVDSQSAIETLSGRYTDEQWGGPSEHCSINDRPGTPEYKACMLEMRNVLDYWIKCNRHAKHMCRQYGGHC